MIIVGGGIVGAATAYELVRKECSVTLIDAAISGEATAAAAGIICPWLSERRNKPWYNLARKGARFYDTLINQLEADGEYDTGFKRVGAIRLLTDEARSKKLYEIAMVRREESPEIGDIHMLNKAATLAKFPFLTGELYSLYISGAARVDGRALRQAMINAAKKHGLEVIHGKASLITSGNNVTGVHVNDQTLTADIVIAANGVWMNELLAPLNLDVTFEMRKGQLIHLYEKTAEDSSLPIVMALRNQYIIPFEAGKFVIGSTSENPDTFNTNITAGAIQTTLNLALETAPGLAESTFVEARTGFRPYTADFLPVFGQVKNISGLLIANGLGASGLTTGPFIGKQLAKIACNEAPEITLEDYQV